ncbi:aspartate:alanine exchanger family transporter [Corynebacterium aquilae]|uniref:Transporter n=1 Tax=Corynebacterium aquilae DSM 44791 TaxID=1431546 RepID=A0A1L7CDK7_9CORY|nr:TrkA C-terminal domain-containing protein [Corynebacterium aquilae]APT83918.1 transporter [Corynebacterium aquilae DSM 44791]
MLEYLAANPLLMIFLFLGLGMAVGSIKVKGVSLGAAAVLFLAIGVSAFAKQHGVELAIPDAVGQVGLATLTFSIGMASGPNFFAAMKTAWAPLILQTIVIVACGAVAFGLGNAFGLSPGIIGGTFAGALNSTPTLAAVAASFPEATVGYAVAYLFGVLAPLGFILLALRHSAQDKDEPQPVENVTIRVERNDGPTLGDVGARAGQELTFSRIRHGDDGPVVHPVAGDVLRRGDLLTVVGTAESVRAATEYLGHSSHHSLMVDRHDLDFRRITVSNPKLYGRRLSSLDVEERFGATISRVRRGDVDMIATGDVQLQPGDRVRVVFPAGMLKDISDYFGDSSRGLTSITPVALGIGMTLGILLGAVNIPLPSGASFSLGAAGGTLLVGLIFGRIGRVGRFATTMPFTATQVLADFGLLVFLAQAGVKAGGLVSDAFAGGDWWKILIVGAAITLTLCTGIYLSMRLVMKMGGTTLAGVIGGSQTQPAVLAFANDRTGGDPRVPVGYAMMFPLAMIVKILVAQTIILF